MNLREVGCGSGRWMELAQGHVLWQALVLVALYIQVLLWVNCWQFCWALSDL